MKNASTEIAIIYDSRDLQDKEALAYAKSLRFRKVKEYDIRKHMFTEQQLERLLQLLDAEPRVLINDKSDVFNRHFKNTNLDREGVVKVLRKYPELMRTPIILYENRAKILGSSYEMIKDEMTEGKRDFENK